MTVNKGTILLIDDNIDDRILLKKYLSLGLYKNWEIVGHVKLSDGIDYIQEHKVDIILLDLSLPDSSGVVSFTRLKKNIGNTPIIVLTGVTDVILAQDLIKFGAQDYLIKGDFEAKLLEMSIAYAIERNYLKLENDLTKEKLVDSVLKAQDDERARIAKELHDGVVQSLTAVSLNLGLLRSSLSQYDVKTLFHYEKCNDNLSQTIDEIKAISHTLMPRVIAELKLVNAIEELIRDMNNVSDMDFKFVANLENELEEKLKISVYRIVQELVNNAYKHSKAKNLLIQLLEYPESISLMVEDNGIGFNREEVLAVKDCFGLYSLESRVNAVGGTMELDTKPGNGTNVFISFSKNDI
ncbi:MAG: signal transduction histidine kinase [Parvicella sp.]|jgi:signal transduction histidine kinase